MNKTIIILRSNPVNPDSRVEKEAAALSDAGYNVHIVCWDRESNHSEAISTIINDKIKISRLGFKASFGEGLKNIKPYLKFQFTMKSWLKKHKDEYNYVHACDFDTAFFTQSTVLRLHKKFVFDLFDFICGNPKNFMQKCVKKAQLKLINKSDATIICTEDRKKQIAGSNPKKLVIIHNTPAEIPFENVKSKSKNISFVYVGILQDFRLLKELVEYFSNHSEYTFNVGGFGIYEELFKEAASKHENINFLGKIPYDKTLQLERESDIMLAIYDPSIENHIFAAPNKFYESLMLGKPVIMVKGTGMSNEVEENNIGITIEYSLDGFDKGVNELISKKKEWKKMSEAARNLYKTKFTWDLMKSRLIDLYNNIEG